MPRSRTRTSSHQAASRPSIPSSATPRNPSTRTILLTLSAPTRLTLISSRKISRSTALNASSTSASQCSTPGPTTSIKLISNTSSTTISPIRLSLTSPLFTPAFFGFLTLSARLPCPLTISIRLSMRLGKFQSVPAHTNNTCPPTNSVPPKTTMSSPLLVTLKRSAILLMKSPLTTPASTLWSLK